MILEPKNIKFLTVSIVSPSISHEVMGPDAMILVFWMLSSEFIHQHWGPSNLVAEREEELRSFLIRMKESEKADLKLNIQKTKIMAFGPITSWQIEGEKWKQWQILFSWVSKSLLNLPERHFPHL